MRLGGPLAFHSDLEAWAQSARDHGYRAVVCPIRPTSDAYERQELRHIAKLHDLVIAEVGIWKNPLSPNEQQAKEARDLSLACLQLAEDIGANCCVNIAGSLGEGMDGALWHGPSARDLTPEAFDRVVQLVRELIDTIKPQRTFFTLEPMPWMLPDSIDSYEALLRAVDRPSFAVHFDPVNWITSPQLFFRNGAFLRECISRLGPHIKSTHAKDIAMRTELTVHLDECRPGTGRLDYGTFLRELNRLGPDTPLLLEHLPAEEEYQLAAAFVRGVAQREGVAL